MRLFIVIPVHDRLAFTRACLAGLAGQAPEDVTIVVVDDGSTDGTSRAVAEEFPSVKLLRGDGTLWWAGAMNVGVGWALDARPTGRRRALPERRHDPASRLPRAAAAGARRRPRRPDRLAPGERRRSRHGCRRRRDGGLGDGQVPYRRAGRSGGRRRHRGRGPGPDLRRVDVLGGRGTLIPVAAFRRTGPYWEQGLRHYAADYELSRRASRAGFGLFVDWASPLDVREEETGIHASVATGGMSGLLRSFWDVRSANDFRVRWRFAVRACPWWALPSYLPCDYARVVVGSVRRSQAR